MATHYHCVDREQIRLCTCLQSVFDPSSRTFVEDEQEIQSKQPSDPHKLLGKKNGQFYSSRFARIREPIRSIALSSNLWTNKWKIVGFINFFSFISVLWICVKCNFRIEKNCCAKLCILILRANIFDTWLMDESFIDRFQKRIFVKKKIRAINVQRNI